MEHTGFSSGEARGRMGVPRYIGGAMGSAARRQAGRVRRTGSGQARAGGMLVKAGLCGVVCAGVLLLRWAEGGGMGFPEGAVAAVSAQAAQEALLATIPMKRLGAPEDVARAVAFFAGEESAYLTGQVLCVDGGMAV